MTAGAALYTYGGPEVCPDGVPSGDPLCTRTGDPIMYFFLDRFDGGTGDANVGFWFFKSVHALLPDPNAPKGTFDGLHDVGDVLVLSEFTIGGGVSTVKIFNWVGDDNGVEDDTNQPAPGTGTGPLQLRAEGSDCAVADHGDVGCASVNEPDDAPVDPPWNYTGKGGVSAYDDAALFEGGVNLRAIGLDLGCGGTFLAETRASQSTDARLHDFAIGDFDLCRLVVEKTGDTLSKVGDDANYTITITNQGAITLFKDDITDTLLGNITLNGVNQANLLINTNTCGASLAPGASCTITATRTVQMGDPDPLPNIVTVVYNSNAALTAEARSATDDHSVNLFQPCVEVTKSGDTTLSKIGDQVTYSFTIDRDCASEDTPTLLLDSIIDNKLGSLTGAESPAACDSLTHGESCSFSVNHTIPPGASDPYVNTVTVHYHPEGFPNDITDQDTHSVNLFQPAIRIDKSGDTVSKVGDVVNYTFTISNNSSTDTTALTCTVTDSLLGPTPTIFGPAVLPPGNTVVNRSRTVLQGDPDPLVNTATMTCTVAGFPNVLTTSDSHSVNVFTPAVQVVKSGPATGTAGETITYSFEITNQSSADGPNLILDSAIDVGTGWAGLGNITAAAAAAGCDVLTSNPSETCNFTVNHTIDAGNPSPLINTVTVHYHPLGFPNAVTDDDQHSLTITTLGQGCTPGFWRSNNGEPRWDELTDPLVQNMPAGLQFITTTTVNAYFGVTAAQSGYADSVSMLDALKGGGGGAGKLIRHSISGLLNIADADMNYQFTDFTALYNAIKSGLQMGVYEPLATELDAANNRDESACGEP